jgi:hypothetical protein
MTPLTTKLPLTLILIAGCEPTPSDERLARMAQETVEQQAQQNEEMARLNREVAEGTNRLVDADSQARQELLAAQRDLQRQQEQVGGLTLLALLPLVLCWYLLHGLSGTDEHLIGDVLIQEFFSPNPTLLPPPAGPSRSLEYLPEADRNLDGPPVQPDQQV